VQKPEEAPKVQEAPKEEKPSKPSPALEIIDVDEKKVTD
jgi:hypothetical protein